MAVIDIVQTIGPPGNPAWALWEMYDATGNFLNGEIPISGQDREFVKYLGRFRSAGLCSLACEGYNHLDRSCSSFMFHTAEHGDMPFQCFGILSNDRSMVDRPDTITGVRALPVAKNSASAEIAWPWEGEEIWSQKDAFLRILWTGTSNGLVSLIIDGQKANMISMGPETNIIQELQMDLPDGIHWISLQLSEHQGSEIITGPEIQFRMFRKARSLYESLLFHSIPFVPPSEEARSVSAEAQPLCSVQDFLWFEPSLRLKVNVDRRSWKVSFEVLVDWGIRQNWYASEQNEILTKTDLDAGSERKACLWLAWNMGYVTVPLNINHKNGSFFSVSHSVFLKDSVSRETEIFYAFLMAESGHSYPAKVIASAQSSMRSWTSEGGCSYEPVGGGAEDVCMFWIEHISAAECADRCCESQGCVLWGLDDAGGCWIHYKDGSDPARCRYNVQGLERVERRIGHQSQDRVVGRLSSHEVVAAGGDQHVQSEARCGHSGDGGCDGHGGAEGSGDWRGAGGKKEGGGEGRKEQDEQRMLDEVCSESDEWVHQPRGRGGGEEERLVVVVTLASNRADFLPLQHEGLRRFLADSFLYLVVNDAPTAALREEISRFCRAAGRRHLVREVMAAAGHLEYAPYDAARRCGETINWVVKEVLVKEYGGDMVVIMDNDMFLTAPFSVASFLRTHPLAGYHSSPHPHPPTCAHLHP